MGHNDDRVKYTELDNNNAHNIVSAISKIYFIFYEVDLENDSFDKYYASKMVSDVTDKYACAHDALKDIGKNLFVYEDTNNMEEFFDTMTWPARLNHKDTIYFDAKGKYTGWVRCNLIVSSRNDKGVPIKVIVAVQDINEEKKKEIRRIKKLDEITSVYDTLIDQSEIVSSAGLGIWHIIISDKHEPRMQVSDKMAELLGIDVSKLTEEEVYSSWYDNVLPEAIESVQKSVQEMIDGSFSENTYKWKHPSKGVIYVRCGGTAINLPDGTCILSGYHSDVTDIVLEEQKRKNELMEARNKAEKASQAKTRFLFNMSHDIRTPMNAIIGYTDLIDKHIDDKEACIDYLNKVRTSSDFLLSLINNVLEMARIESGKITLDESVVLVDSVRQEIIDVYSELTRKKGIQFNTISEVKTKHIYCDSVKLKEIYLNIVSNAYKYTLEGGRIDFFSKELPHEKKGWIYIQTVVEDTGIGMSKEYLPIIFDEFSREHNMTEIKIQGTGLGMTIVKKLVDIMNGTITVESELGKGTKFVITIPHRIASEPMKQLKTANKVDSSDFVGKRILLAEDNDLNAEIAIEILKEVGLVVERACDGIQCVDMLVKNPDNYYDVIIMDIQMPNLNGYEATRRIRSIENKAKANIPIIAMTANAFEEDKKDAFDAGMNDHLAKPINVKELMKKLGSLLK